MLTDNIRLETTLGELIAQVDQLLNLQAAEDEIPNPPGFAETVGTWNTTLLCRELAEDEEDEEDEEEGFDSGRMREVKLLREVGTIRRLLPLEMPDPQVEVYPFKTSQGHLIEDCDNRIRRICLNDISGVVFSNEDRWLAKKVMKQCLQKIRDRFPDAVSIGGIGQPDNPLPSQHYFIFFAHKSIKVKEKAISRLQELSLIRALRIKFHYWLEFQAKRILSGLKRKLSSWK